MDSNVFPTTKNTTTSDGARRLEDSAIFRALRAPRGGPGSAGRADCVGQGGSGPGHSSFSGAAPEGPSLGSLLSSDAGVLSQSAGSSVPSPRERDFYEINLMRAQTPALAKAMGLDPEKSERHALTTPAPYPWQQTRQLPAVSGDNMSSDRSGPSGAAAHTSNTTGRS